MSLAGRPGGGNKEGGENLKEREKEEKETPFDATFGGY